MSKEVLIDVKPIDICPKCEKSDSCQEYKYYVELREESDRLLNSYVVFTYIPTKKQEKEAYDRLYAKHENASKATWEAGRVVAEQIVLDECFDERSA